MSKILALTAYRHVKTRFRMTGFNEQLHGKAAKPRNLTGKRAADFMRMQAGSRFLIILISDTSTSQHQE